MQSTTWYYVHEPKYEHVTTWVHMSSETNMEAEIVYFANLTQKLTIEANPAQELEAEISYAQ